MSDILQAQGINSKGFGTIPKMVMLDRRLNAQAKAIYSYFASYAGGGRAAFPSREKIIADLRMCIESYYKGVNKLKAFGYLMVEQEKTPKGRFKRNVYTLTADIPIASPCTASPYTVEQDTEPCTVSPYTEKQYTNINSIEYKQGNVNINSLSSPSAPISAGSTDRRADIDDQTITTYEILIKANIGYESFQEGRPSDIGLVDEIIAVMVDVLVTSGTYVALDGENKPRKLVSRRLMELGHWHIEHVLGQFKAVTAPIKKKRQYLLTMLYNAALEFDAHYTNELCSALNGGGQ